MWDMQCDLSWFVPNNSVKKGLTQWALFMPVNCSKKGPILLEKWGSNWTLCGCSTCNKKKQMYPQIVPWSAQLHAQKITDVLCIWCTFRTHISHYTQNTHEITQTDTPSENSKQTDINLTLKRQKWYESIHFITCVNGRWFKYLILSYDYEFFIDIFLS